MKITHSNINMTVMLCCCMHFWLQTLD